jgi:hypothetical protein
LGSNNFSTLREPKIALVVGDGVSSLEAGEIWHVLDTRFHIPVSLVPMDNFDRINYDKYNTIIMASGSYNSLSDGAKERLKVWVQKGGVIVAQKTALNWLTSAALGKFDMKKSESKDESGNPKPYSDISFTAGAQSISGAIFEIQADLTHPLFYGYTNSRIPVFKSGALFMERSKNAFGNPATFTANPLISGYITRESLDKLKNASFVGSSSIGQGRVIGFTENLAFRAFWFGSNKMLMNAIFFGHTISSGASR